MAETYLGEISMFGFNFAPEGWSACDGQILPTSQNAALFSLLSDHYGGNGSSTFGLPQLQGRVPVSFGTYVYEQSIPYPLGSAGGTPQVTLSPNQLPPHTHSFNATTEIANRVGNMMGGSQIATTPKGGTYEPLFTSATSLTSLNASISSEGGGLAHSNIQPYQVVYFGIALTGLYPSRN